MAKRVSKAEKKPAKRQVKKHSQTCWAVQVGKAPNDSVYFMVREGDWPHSPHRPDLFASKEQAQRHCTQPFHKPVRVRVTVI